MRQKLPPCVFVHASHEVRIDRYRYTLTKPDSAVNVEKDPALVAKHLEEAFAIFYAESQKLEAQQADLQEKINQLSSELQQSNQRLGILLNAIPAGVILLENNIVLLHNPAVLQFLPSLSKGNQFALPSEWQASIAPGEYVIGNPEDRNAPQKMVQVIQINEGMRSFIQI